MEMLHMIQVIFSFHAIAAFYRRFHNNDKIDIPEEKQQSAWCGLSRPLSLQQRLVQ